MHKSVWMWPWSVMSAEADAIVERLAGMGVRRLIVVLSSYRSLSWVDYHKPARPTVTTEPGVLYFPADGADFGAVKPVRSEVFRADVLARAVELGQRHGLEIEGLVHLLTNANLAARQPELASMSMDGSRDSSHLCPNHPDVRAYVRALVRAVAAYPVTAVGVDKIRYRQLPSHVGGRRMDPAAQALMSICFCEHCQAAFSEKGINAHRLLANFERLVGPTPALELDPSLPPGDTGLANLLLQYPPLYRLLQLRMEVMGELARELKAEADAAGKALSGAVEPPISVGHDERTSVAGMLGVHYPSLCQIYEPLYSVIHGPTAKVSYEYAWARRLCADFANRLVPGLRLYGDATPEEVRDSTAAAAEAGATHLAYWCYDWARPECLEAIG